MNKVYNVYTKNLRTADLKYVGSCEGKCLVEAFEGFKTSNRYNKRKYYVLIPNEAVALGSMWNI